MLLDRGRRRGKAAQGLPSSDPATGPERRDRVFRWKRFFRSVRHGLMLLQGRGDCPASLGIEREDALASPARVAASAIGLNGVRQLERSTSSSNTQWISGVRPWRSMASV